MSFHIEIHDLLVNFYVNTWYCSYVTYTVNLKSNNQVIENSLIQKEFDESNSLNKNLSK